MSKSNKFLVLLFLFLVVIIFGELIFYMGFNNQPKSNYQSTCITPTPVFLANTKPAFHQKTVEQFQKMTLASEAKLTINVETKTEVLDIKHNVGDPKTKFFPIALKVRISESKNKSLWMYMSKHLVDNTFVSFLKNGKESNATFADIKIGDSILIKEIYDPSFAPGDPKQLVSNKLAIIR